MKENRSSLTAALIGLIVALRWHCHSNDRNAKLQAELLRNISWRHMSLPLWTVMRIILCHRLITKSFLYLSQRILGQTKSCEGVWMRKAYMERQVRTFLDKAQQAMNSTDRFKGLQVIILAAGYDTLAWRLAAEYPDVKFIEVDHPATGRAKKDALHTMLRKRRCKKIAEGDVTNAYLGSELPSLLYFCHEAIGESCTLQDALGNNIENAANSGYKGSISQSYLTAVVIEGLTFYLTEEENINIFRELGELFGNHPDSGVREICKCMVAFDFFTLDKFGRPYNSNIARSKSPWLMSLMKYKVMLFGEPFKWGITPEELPAFFDGTGWELVPSEVTWPGTECDTVATYSTMMGIEYEATVKWKGI